MRLGRRFYMTLVLIILLMGIGYAFAPFFTIGQWALFVLALSVLVDGVMLYRVRGIRAFRQCATRFSNGDENAVNIRVESSYPYPVAVEVVDEIPFVFQLRNVDFRMKLRASEGRTITYHLPSHAAGDLLFRTDSGVCGRQDGTAFPQIYLRCSSGCQGISVLSDASSV